MSSSDGISPPPLKRKRLSLEPPSPPHSALPPSHAIIPSNKCLSVNAQTALTVYSWNINGIGPFIPPQTTKITSFLTTTSLTKPPPKHPSLRTCLRRWKWPHILCLQEVKIAPPDRKTQSAVRRAINAPLDTDDEGDANRYLYDAAFCLSKDKYNATGFGGKVYGVCTLIRRDVGGVTVKEVQWDVEGRVQLVEIPNLGVVVLNVYAVNGTTNEYRDPESGKVVGTRHDRKRAFHSLLATEVRGYEERGWGVVVAGDINISRTGNDSFPRLRMGEEHVRNRTDFEEKIMQGLGMVDTFRKMHGEERKFTYRPRNKPWGTGGDRVDLILASKLLGDAVKEADILDSEVERGPSDHVPLFVELVFGQGMGERVDRMPEA